jgi:hypothetical protein
MSNIFLSTSQTPGQHIEGDVWSEGGKTWTIKNGIKRTVTKMDQARKEFLMPLSCPRCKNAMKAVADTTMWTIHRCCLNCVVADEHEIRKAGKWEEYEKSKMTANAQAFCDDMETALQEYIQTGVSRTNVTEDGTLESWKDVDKDRLQTIVDDEVGQMKKIVEDLKNK